MDFNAKFALRQLSVNSSRAEPETSKGVSNRGGCRNEEPVASAAPVARNRELYSCIGSRYSTANAT
jgi:hypothetical protein